MPKKENQRRRRSLFCTRLRKLSRERGLTGYEIARKTRLVPNTVYYYLRGEREPDITNLRKLMRAFPDISVDWMLGRSSIKERIK